MKILIVGNIAPPSAVHGVATEVAGVTSPAVVALDEKGSVAKTWTTGYSDAEVTTWATAQNVHAGTSNLIDIGPFLDRFGTSKMAVLSSTNATVKALVLDVTVRKWIDLSRADVAAGIDMIIAAGITGINKAAILAVPVGGDENLALRKQYFNG